MASECLGRGKTKIKKKKALLFFCVRGNSIFVRSAQISVVFPWANVCTGPRSHLHQSAICTLLCRRPCFPPRRTGSSLMGDSTVESFRAGLNPFTSLVSHAVGQRPRRLDRCYQKKEGERKEEKQKQKPNWLIINSHFRLQSLGRAPRVPADGRPSNLIVAFSSPPPVTAFHRRACL